MVTVALNNNAQFVMASLANQLYTICNGNSLTN
jgi:hypothetical protein